MCLGIRLNVRSPRIYSWGVCHKRCVSKGSYQRTKGKRSEKSIPKGKICGFKRFDKVEYNGVICFTKGRKNTGYAVLSDINNKTIDFPHTPKLTEMQRLTARKSTISIRGSLGTLLSRS